MDTPKQKHTHILQKEIVLGGVSPLEVALFTKHLSLTLKSGIPLPEGLQIMTAQTKGRMKQITTDILHKVRSGSDFHTALSAHKKYFSQVYINMVKTGEASGTLETKLEKLAIQLKKLHLIKKKVQSAMIYPSIIFVAIVGLGLSIALFVLPKILPLFETIDVELPTSTKILIATAKTLENHGDIILPAFFGGLIFLFWLCRRRFMQPITHRILLGIPVVKKIVKNITLEKFTYTLGSLLESGLTINASLSITADSMNNYCYKQTLEKAVDRIVAGQTLAQALEKKTTLFPPITTKMISVGENTGTLGTSLGYLSEFYEEEVDETMKNLSNILEPVMLICIGLLVAGVAMSILGPIYQITGNLHG